MASFDTTRRLAGALEAARTFRRQSAGLLALLLACSAWILSPVHAPEPFAGLLLGVAACALVIELALALAARRRAAGCADELILSGFPCESMRTPVERAIARRAAWLERPRTRRRLAKHLRWRLKLAEGSLGVSLGYMRTSVHPPLARYERNALLVNYTLIREMADRLTAGRPIPARSCSSGASSWRRRRSTEARSAGPPVRSCRRGSGLRGRSSAATARRGAQRVSPSETTGRTVRTDRLERRLRRRRSRFLEVRGPSQTGAGWCAGTSPQSAPERKGRIR